MSNTFIHTYFHTYIQTYTHILRTFKHTYRVRTDTRISTPHQRESTGFVGHISWNEKEKTRNDVLKWRSNDQIECFSLFLKRGGNVGLSLSPTKKWCVEREKKHLLCGLGAGFVDDGEFEVLLISKDRLHERHGALLPLQQDVQQGNEAYSY